MKTAKTTNRRKFLLAAGLGAGTAAAVVTATKKAAPAAGDSPTPAEPSGYRVTAHIEKYYKTTKV
jgi:hypothetical protein